MSFAKIAEARAVKKIVAYLRQQGPELEQEFNLALTDIVDIVADRIEAGAWKTIKLPKRKKARR